jgi:hypothetical protein
MGNGAVRFQIEVNGDSIDSGTEDNSLLHAAIAANKEHRQRKFLTLKEFVCAFYFFPNFSFSIPRRKLVSQILI